MAENQTPWAWSFGRSSAHINTREIPWVKRQIKREEGEAQTNNLGTALLSLEGMKPSSVSLQDSGTEILGFMLKELEKPERQIQPGDYLLVKSMDRLLRMPELDAIQLVAQTLGKGLNIVSVSENVVHNKKRLNHQPDSLLPLLRPFLRKGSK